MANYGQLIRCATINCKMGTESITVHNGTLYSNGFRSTYRLDDNSDLWLLVANGNSSLVSFDGHLYSADSKGNIKILTMAGEAGVIWHEREKGDYCLRVADGKLYSLSETIVRCWDNVEQMLEPHQSSQENTKDIGPIGPDDKPSGSRKEIPNFRPGSRSIPISNDELGRLLTALGPAFPNMDKLRELLTRGPIEPTNKSVMKGQIGSTGQIGPTGDERNRLIGVTGPTGYRSALMIRPSLVFGEMLCAVMDPVINKIQVWNLSREEHVGVLEGHTRIIACLTKFQSRLYSGSYDCTIRKWNVNQGTCQMVLKGHKAAITSLCSFGDYLVSGSFDHIIRLWNSDDQCLQEITMSNRPRDLYVSGSSLYSLQGDYHQGGNIIRWQITPPPSLLSMCLSWLRNNSQRFSKLQLLQLPDDILYRIEDLIDLLPHGAYNVKKVIQL